VLVDQLVEEKDRVVESRSLFFVSVSVDMR